MEGKFDAVACTGYFGLSAAQRASFNVATTGDDVAKAVLANVRCVQTTSPVSRLTNGAKAYHVASVA